MRMPHHLSRTLLVLALLAASGDACSPSARSGRPTTSPAPPTPVPADLSITVPKGDIEEIDGIVGHSEWAHAQRANLVPEGELLLMHDAQLASNQKADFLQENGWVASTMGTGNPGEMEYRIALPEGDVRLAVVYFTGDVSAEHLASWPAQLADSCRQTALIQGRAAITQRFQPAQWVSITALPGN